MAAGNLNQSVARGEMAIDWPPEHKFRNFAASQTSVVRAGTPVAMERRGGHNGYDANCIVCERRIGAGECDASTRPGDLMITRR